jgi:very-short-patch-repair endonuclease
VFLALLRREKVPAPEVEVRFHPTRRWRFDYAWPAARVALEVEGGAFSGGRHTRGAGFRRDMEKYNEAARLGWVVLRCLPEQLRTTETARLVADVRRQREAA